MICLAYCYFSQWLQHFLPSLLVLSNSNILIVLIPSYSFPSLNWVIKLTLNWATVPHIEIAKRCIPENDLFGQHDYNIQFIDSFRFCVSLILLYNYHWHPFFFFFLLLYLRFRIFLIANDWHLRQTKKILVARFDDHIWQINE